MQLIVGLVFSVASIILPVFAWGIFQTTINIKLFNLSKLPLCRKSSSKIKTLFLDIYNWNVFLFLCALPSLVSGTAIIFMPESPKFLMSMGANDKAMEVFRKVYTLNTGNPIDSYPIKSLVDELQLKEGPVSANRTKIQAIKEGWQQIACLFAAPYRCKVILVCLIQMSLISG